MLRGSIHSLNRFTVSPLPAPSTPLTRISTGNLACAASCVCRSSSRWRSFGSCFLNSVLPSLWPISADSNMPASLAGLRAAESTRGARTPLTAVNPQRGGGRVTSSLNPQGFFHGMVDVVIPVSKIRRARSTPKGRAIDPVARAEVASVLQGVPLEAQYLIENLHRVQDRFGSLSAARLNALAEAMKLAQAEVYEVATFYHHFDVVKEGEDA